MGDSIEKQELVKRIARRLSKDPVEVEAIVDTTLEVMYDALKRGESISLRHFGTFYIDWRHTGTVFKFNPSQRLRALFGWSSTYKSEV